MSDVYRENQLKSGQKSDVKSKLNVDNDDSSGIAESDIEENCAFDILKLKKLNGNSLINLSKINSQNYSKDEKINCKIMKFSSDLNLDDVLLKIPKLNAEEYPNLFIFIIHADDLEIFDQNAREYSEKFKMLQNFLINFFKNRPIVLQVTSINLNATKFFYKDDCSEKLLTIDQQISDFETHKDFPMLFMMAINGTIDVIENLKADDLLHAKNSCLILKFLRTFQLSEGFLVDLILLCGENGTPDQLLAALDDPFGLHYLIRTLESRNGVTQSVLCAAVMKSNIEVVDHLIQKCTYLIQQLSHEHKTDISTAAFTSGQYEILCDLLKYSDFPFPNLFDSASINYDHFHQIVDERRQFHDAIAKQDKKAVEKFIDKNSDLKFAFDAENKSALSHALTSKSYELFFYLQSLGFQATEDVNYENFLEGDELRNVRNAALRQLHDDIRTSAKSEEWSVLILSAKCMIHNKKLKPEIEAKYRKRIQKWFREIRKSKLGSKLINAAAQCEQLKFIFDFECKSVANMRMASRSLGATFPKYKWIMIGAEMPTKKREQEIKGTIAHELCHYVMRMVFENKDKPYYIKDLEAFNEFDEISIEINKWTIPDSTDSRNDEQVDDECEGIISTAFTEYEHDEYHLELIVRVPQIYVQFDYDDKKVADLEKKYKKLFNFYRVFVLPEMMKLNSKNRKFNKICELLPEIENSPLEFSITKDLSPIYSNNHVVVASNVPKLLFVYIYKHLCDVTRRPIIDDKNIFIKSQHLNNSEIINEYKSLQIEHADMVTYIECTNEIGNNFTSIFITGPQKLIFVVQSEDQSTNLTKRLEQLNHEVHEAILSFEWNDLTLKCRRKLIYFKLNFQTRKSSFYSLLTREEIEGELEEQEEKIATELKEVIDEQLLNLLVEESKISINIKFLKELSKDMDFMLLCQCRYFIKVTESENKKISQEELIEDTKDQKFILISDIAGSGKSWALKSITKYLQENFPTCWVTYVELKDFINAFQSMTTDTNFLTFMLENVLKDHQKFESKIFEKIYEIGKVFVLFDGFDEIIGPNYRELVVGIIKSFESNGGNQMWIATRDYFEVDLKKHLDLDVAYKIDEFTEQDGVDLISSIWVLNEMGSDEKVGIKPDDIKTSPNFKTHQKHAQKLMEKLSKLQFKSIGFPQFYKMAAEVFKNGTVNEHDLNIFNFYKEIILNQIKIWSKEKGELRQNFSTMVHTKTVKFMDVHQILAMKMLFLDEDDFFTMKYDNESWPDVEIFGCGFVTRSDENFTFLHETFRDFFAADFVASQLKKGKYSDFFKFFVKFFSESKFGVIRKFINDALADGSIHEKIKSKKHKLVKIFTKNISDLENISYVFKENLSNVKVFIIDVLNNCDNEKAEAILNSTAYLYEKNQKQIK